jgi:hypothetical protein
MLKLPARKDPVKRWFGAPGMVPVDVEALQRALLAAKAEAQAASEKRSTAPAQPFAQPLPSQPARLTACSKLGQAERATESEKRPAEEWYQSMFSPRARAHRNCSPARLAHNITIPQVPVLRLQHQNRA